MAESHTAAEVIATPATGGADIRPLDSNKRARPTPPIEDPANLELVFDLSQLQRMWNLLDWDGYSVVRYDEQERRSHLLDMRSIIRDGGCDYQNPFGADDREEFADQFSDLKDAEQRAFRSRAAACLAEGRTMTIDHVNEVLVAAGPKEPYAVSLLPTANASIANGTERRPFASLKAAAAAVAEVRDHSMLRLIHCPPSCSRIKCLRRGCTKMLCTKHGDGRGCFNEEGGDENGVSWFFSKCIECKVSVACQDHEFPNCDVCRNTNRAQISLGMDDTCCSYPLCYKCESICDGQIGDDPEDRVVRKGIGGKEEGSGESSEAGVCSFRCCTECIGEHTCGDDPSEYC